MFHEIFNEPDQAQVFEFLKTWLDQQLPVAI
jgi:alpha-beta hydrolase superfamily lysophospholipase